MRSLPTDEITMIQQSFSDFYANEHAGQVRRAYLMLGSSPMAHDVVAEAFTQVFRRWSAIESPGPYLNRCVLNGCRDAGQRASRDLAAVEPLGETETEASLDAHLDLDLIEALMRLPFRQRAALVLRYYGAASEIEISATLRCRPGTVGSLIHRGLTNLRKELGS